MRVFTSHLRPGAPPVLVREGFCWPAFWFGFLYLAAHRAWIAAGLNLAAFLLVLGLTRAAGTDAPLLGLAVLQGLFAQDLRRWSLALHGLAAGPVVAAPDYDQAFARLLTERADLLASTAGR